MLIIGKPVAELRRNGVESRGEPTDEGFGIVVLPGGVDVTLHEPRHPLAI